jgi:pilus assembly protein Flp/PilA
MAKIAEILTEFVESEDGAQILEYALIISLISVGLAIALEPLTIGASFDGFITRVKECVGTGTCP